MKTETRCLSNAQVIETLDMINRAGKCSSLSLPIKLLWELKKDISKLEDIRRDFLAMDKDLNEPYMDDVHSELVRQKDGSEVRVVKKGYLEEFMRKKKELMEADNEVDLAVFSIKDFGDVDLTLGMLQALSVFIDD